MRAEQRGIDSRAVRRLRRLGLHLLLTVDSLGELQLRTLPVFLLAALEGSGVSGTRMSLLGVF